MIKGIVKSHAGYGPYHVHVIRPIPGVAFYDALYHAPKEAGWIHARSATFATSKKRAIATKPAVHYAMLIATESR